MSILITTSNIYIVLLKLFGVGDSLLNNLEGIWRVPTENIYNSHGALEEYVVGLWASVKCSYISLKVEYIEHLVNKTLSHISAMRINDYNKLWFFFDIALISHFHPVIIIITVILLVSPHHFKLLFCYYLLAIL